MRNVGLLLVTGVGLLAALTAPGSTPRAALAAPLLAAPTTVDISPGDATGASWNGLGVNWSAYDNGTTLPASLTNVGSPTPYDLSAQQWQATQRRLDFMSPGFARVDIDSIWYCANPCATNGFQYDFQSPMMKNLARTLDDLKRRGTPVLLGFFDANQWASPALSGDPAFARMIADGIDYVVHTRGDDNIRWFGGINELNDYKFTPDQVDTLLHNVRAALDARGLTSIAIAGPDTAQLGTPCTAGADGCLGWMQLHEATGNYYPRTAQQTGHLGEIGLWDTHWYPSRAQIAAGQVESELRSTLADLRTFPTTSPLVLGEVGNYLVDAPDDAVDLNNVSGHRAEDGLAVGDIALQVARSGASGAALWCTDSMNFGFDCGMWNMATDPAPRQRFTTWSILARFLPAGSTIYSPSGAGGVRLVVARTATGGWTIAAVNPGASASSLSVRFQAGQAGGPADSELTAPMSFSQYLSQPLHGPADDVDGDYLPLPVSQLTAQLSNGVPLTVPAQSVVVLTTMAGAGGQEHALHLTATNAGGVAADHTVRMSIDDTLPLYGILPGDRLEYDVQLDSTVAGAGGIDILATDGSRLSAAPEWSATGARNPASPDLRADGGGRVHQSILIPPSFDLRVASRWEVTGDVAGATTSWGARYSDILVRNARGAIIFTVYVAGHSTATTATTAGASAQLVEAVAAVTNLGLGIDNDATSAGLPSAAVTVQAAPTTLAAGDIIEYDVRLTPLAAPRTGNVQVDDAQTSTPPRSLCPAVCTTSAVPVSFPGVPAGSLRAGGIDLVFASGTTASASGASDGLGRIDDPIGLFTGGASVWLHRRLTVPATAVGQSVVALALTGHDPTPGLHYQTMYANVEVTDSAGTVQGVLSPAGMPVITAAQGTGCTALVSPVGAPLSLYGT